MARINEYLGILSLVCKMFAEIFMDLIPLVEMPSKCPVCGAKMKRSGGVEAFDYVHALRFIKYCPKCSYRRPNCL